MGEGRVSDLVMLVTGSTQGLGLGIARHFVSEGAKGVVLCGRNEFNGSQAVESFQKSEPSCKVAYLKVDLSDAEQCASLVDRAVVEMGSLDVVVNCAAITDRGTIEDTPAELFNEIIAVNLRAPFFVSQGAIRHWTRTERGGSLINISSDAAYGGAGFIAAYSMSKGALNTMTKNIAASHGRKGIRCNALCIGQTLTDNEHATQIKVHNQPSNWVEQADADAFSGRILRPDDVAEMVTYLASPASQLMNGSLIDLGVNRPQGPYFVP